MNPLIDFAWHYDHGCKSFQLPDGSFSTTKKSTFDQHHRLNQSKQHEINPLLQPKAANTEKVKVEVKSEQSSEENNLISRYVEEQNQSHNQNDDEEVKNNSVQAKNQKNSKNLDRLFSENNKSLQKV